MGHHSGVGSVSQMSLLQNSVSLGDFGGFCFVLNIVVSRSPCRIYSLVSIVLSDRCYRGSTSSCWTSLSMQLRAKKKKDGRRNFYLIKDSLARPLVLHT